MSCFLNSFSELNECFCHFVYCSQQYTALNNILLSTIYCSQQYTALNNILLSTIYCSQQYTSLNNMLYYRFCVKCNKLYLNTSISYSENLSEFHEYVPYNLSNNNSIQFNHVNFRAESTARRPIK
jgi:hypothetical protein